MIDVKVGMEMQFYPQTLVFGNEDGSKGPSVMVGKVVYVHKRGRFAMVEFTFRGNVLRECFLLPLTHYDTPLVKEARYGISR